MKTNDITAATEPATASIALELAYLRSILGLGSALLVDGLLNLGDGRSQIPQKTGEELLALLAVGEAHAGRLLDRIDEAS